MENKRINIEMEDMVGKTYFSIATWFNQDFNTDEERQLALKNLSTELIQTILEDTFLQLDGVVDTEAKTVGNDVDRPTINKTSGGTGKMFTVNQENAFINALKKEKQ